MGRWTLDDIPWEQLDRSKIDAQTLNIIKAASMVERQSGDYGAYLCSVFHDDPEFQQVARGWAAEEIQHGEALRRYAETADPEFDFEAAYARFTDEHHLPLEATESVRGSRARELVARCVVEVGTSTYYCAMRDATEEPVLKALCHRIAGDEFRHYKLFYDNMKRYQAKEGLTKLARIKVALGRLAETEDDELAYAYYCGTGMTGPYDREAAVHAYGAQTFSLYRFRHVQRGVGMALKAVGLRPQSLLGRMLIRFAWWRFKSRVRQFEQATASA